MPALREVLAALTLLCAGLTAPPAAADSGLLPLWPPAPGSGGSWDAAQTALRFTRDFLGFTGIDRVTSVEPAGDQAWVGVGALLPDGEPRTAATIHLARFGDAPAWRVVGTRDSILTLDRPAYGSAATAVIDAGGVISGVDESLHLQVRQGTRPGLLGESCCTPAGGIEQPWSARVAVTPPDPGPVTLVVSTGGHVAEVEVFAITALRVP